MADTLQLMLEQSLSTTSIFFLKAHHSFLVLSNLDSLPKLCLEAIVNSKITNLKHKNKKK